MALTYIRQTLFFFRQNLMQLAAIQLPFLIILALVKFILFSGLEDDPSSPVFQRNMVIASIMNLALLPFYWGATLFYLQSVVDNEPLSTGAAISKSLSCWGRLLLTYILNGIAVMIGIFCLIVPGIYLGVRFSFADYICVLHNKSPVESMKSSWETTPEYFWALLQGMALIMGVLALASILISKVIPVNSMLDHVISLVFDFLGVLVTIYGFRIFCVMREAQHYK